MVLEAADLFWFFLDLDENSRGRLMEVATVIAYRLSAGLQPTHNITRRMKVSQRSKYAQSFK